MAEESAPKTLTVPIAPLEGLGSSVNQVLLGLIGDRHVRVNSFHYMSASGGLLVLTHIDEAIKKLRFSEDDAEVIKDALEVLGTEFLQVFRKENPNYIGFPKFNQTKEILADSLYKMLRKACALADEECPDVADHVLNILESLKPLTTAGRLQAATAELLKHDKEGGALTAREIEAQKLTESGRLDSHSPKRQKQTPEKEEDA